MSLKELEKHWIGERFNFLDCTGVERRTGAVMQLHLNLYPAVRNLPRVFTKIGDVPICQRPWFSVGDIPDCLVEISAHAKWPDFSLQKPCQTCTEVCRNREVKSCNQSQYETERCEKNDESGLFSHEPILFCVALV